MKTKTIRVTKRVSKWVDVETTRTVPVWYISFLKWLFLPEKALVDAELRERKDEAYENADRQARWIKEKIMQQKLWELGYEVLSTMPEAKDKPGDIPTVFDHKRPPFEIITRPSKPSKD